MNLKTYFDFWEQDRANRRKYRKSGIYGFFLKDECVYVGQSRDLHSRFFHHSENFAKVRPKKIPSNQKYILLRPYIELIEWRALEYCPKDQLDDTENKWIDYYNPIFNIKRKDGQVHWEGNEKDIAAFVTGEVSMDDLKKLLSNN